MSFAALRFPCGATLRESRVPIMDLTDDDVLQILKILDESDYEHLHLEVGELKLVVDKRGSSEGGQGLSARANGEMPAKIERAIPVDLPVEKTAVREDANRPDEASEFDGLLPIRSPMLGTFYRSPKPGDPPFVETGQFVEEETTVCIIEVMKLFSTISAEVRGRVTRICADDGQLVEYNQVLFLVEPHMDNRER
jgi:acetyl-CoA carboxylase biotin carboxyl carrier protein